MIYEFNDRYFQDQMGYLQTLALKMKVENMGGKLTFFQLVIHYDQEGHRDHEEVEDKANLTQLTDGRPTHLLHHRLVGALATDGRGVAQDDQTTDQEYKGDLSWTRTSGEQILDTG